MRTLIRGGLVYDGTGEKPRYEDILIEGGRIAAMDTGLPCDGARIIEAAGRVVTPGFVDIHRHCDVAAIRDADFGQLELAQGITSVVAGNCGLAPVPAASRFRESVYDYLNPVTGPVPAGWEIYGFEDWICEIKKTGLPLNMGFLVGAGAVKAAVNGFDKTPLPAPELAQAVSCVREGMEAGAMGLSLGLMYQPECWSTHKELVALARPAAEKGGILCTHIRGEGDSLIESVEEVISVAEEAGLPLNISHFKAAGIRNWHRLAAGAIERIEQARGRGIPVTADFYPYTGGSTTLQSLLPPTVLEDEPAVMLKNMGTPAGKQRLCRELDRVHPGWDNMAESIGWSRIIVSAVSLPEHAAYQGRNLMELTEAYGCSHPGELIAELLHSENGRVGIIVMSMSQKDVDDIARLPYTALISDALYADSANPHPRLYGAFPHFLREYALERRVVPVETAIHKMTGMPAKRLRLSGRGILTPGAHGDVLVFDLNHFRDRADFIHSKRMAEGMDLVLLDGEAVWQQGRMEAINRGNFLYKE